MASRKRPALRAAGRPPAAKRHRRNLGAPPCADDGGKAATSVSSTTTTTAGGNRARFASMESYKVLKKIGKGGFGVVSMAQHVRTGDVYAIKSVLKGGNEAELLREAGLLALCRGNPAVVELREVARCPETGKLYLVMEYVGRSLSGLLRQRLAFSERDTRHVMRKLLVGVETMHAQGVVHRDIKPENILVGEHDRRIKICDFGISKTTSTSPPHTGFMGTTMYMAPELLLGEEDYGAPIDLWALGCTMGELLIGSYLFDQRSDQAVLWMIADTLGVPGVGYLDAPAPSQLRKMVPEKLLSRQGFDVLSGLLEYDPKKRLTATAALQMPWFATEAALPK